MLLDLQILGFGDWTDIDKFIIHKSGGEKMWNMTNFGVFGCRGLRDMV